MKTLLLILFPFMLSAHDPWAYYKTDDFKHYQAGIMINGAACSTTYFFTGNHKKALLVGNVVSIGATVFKSFVFVIYIDKKRTKQEKINMLL